MPSRNSWPTRCGSVISASVRAAHVADPCGVPAGLPGLPDHVGVAPGPDGRMIADESVEPDGAVPQDTATSATINQTSSGQNHWNRRIPTDRGMAKG